MMQLSKCVKVIKISELFACNVFDLNLPYIYEKRRYENGILIKESVEVNDNSLVYLQEDFSVTLDVFCDLNVLFSSSENEWIEFCNKL